MTWDFLFLWLTTGAVCTMLARWSWHLSFEPAEHVTVGTLLVCILGCLFMPAPAAGAVILALCWAFDGYDETKYNRVKWPSWWLGFRYRQHRITRAVWYLGNPPTKENWLGGWRTYGKGDGW